MKIPFYKFWNPNGGFIGGCIMGFVVGSLIILWLEGMHYLFG